MNVSILMTRKVAIASIVLAISLAPAFAGGKKLKIKEELDRWSLQESALFSITNGFTLESTTRFALSQASQQMTVSPDAITATSTWNGGGAPSVNWSTGANWGGTAPTSASTTDLIFAGTTNVGTSGTPLNNDITSSFLFNSITFSSGGGAFFLGGSSLGMTNATNTITQSSSSNESIANAFVHAGANSSRILALAGNGTGIVTLSGAISEGTGQRQVGITKTGSSTFVLSGANTYSGGTTISAGTLQFAKTNAMPSSGSVTASSGATLAVNVGGTGEWTSAASGNGSLGGLIAGTGGQGSSVSWTAGSVLGIDTTNASGGNFTYSNVIGSFNTGGNSVGLTKLGTGTLTLTGANTYTGGTTVNRGTLLVSNTSGSGTGTGNVTVNNSGTILGGTGSITGNITLGNVTAGAILNPGPSGTAGTAASVGTLTTTGALTLTGANTFHVDASGILTTNWDKMVANGVTLGTTSTLQLSIASGLTFTNGTQYTLINNTSVSAISGTFSGIAQGGTYNFDGYNFMASYIGGTGNDFVLTVTAVPEPSTWIGGALALVAIGYTQRKRFGRFLKRA